MIARRALTAAAVILALVPPLAARAQDAPKLAAPLLVRRWIGPLRGAAAAVRRV